MTLAATTYIGRSFQVISGNASALISPLAEEPAVARDIANSMAQRSYRRMAIGIGEDAMSYDPPNDSRSIV
jgi:hypothetical protein